MKMDGARPPDGTLTDSGRPAGMVVRRAETLVECSFRFRQGERFPAPSEPKRPRSFFCQNVNQLSHLLVSHPLGGQRPRETHSSALDPEPSRPRRTSPSELTGRRHSR